MILVLVSLKTSFVKQIFQLYNCKKEKGIYILSFVFAQQARATFLKKYEIILASFA
jgi:uncharacterized protein with PQ loop repeat